MTNQKPVLKIVFLLILILQPIPPACAEEFPLITAQELKSKMDSGTPLFLLDPLSDIEFNEQHIPGSVNIPLATIPATDQLPQDKSTLIVTYCLGPK